MTVAKAGDLRSMEGRRVGVALADRSCIDGAVLEAVVSGKLWLHTSGEDVFVALSDVVDVWEVSAGPRRRDDNRIA